MQGRGRPRHYLAFLNYNFQYVINSNKKMNYFIALFLGLVVPFGFFMVKSAVNNKLESQENLERITTKL